MLRRFEKLGFVLLGALWASACVSSGGQSGTEALDVGKGDASIAPTTNPPPIDETDLEVSDSPDPQPPHDAGADDSSVLPEGSFKLLVDYYQNACPDPGSPPFCLRFAEDDAEYQIDPAVTWPEYEWGHYYELAAHWEATDTADGGAAQRLVVDEVLKDEIKVGQVFTIRVDPTLDTLGYMPQINYDIPTGMSSLETGPSFDCAGDACGSLSEVMSKNERFDARFEIGDDGQLTLVNVEVSEDDSSALVMHLSELSVAWEGVQPNQYVVKVCGTGFVPPECLLVSINESEVVESEVQSAAGVWMPTDSAPNPIWALFAEAENAAEIEVDPTYSYVSSYTQRSISESWGKEVSCFVVDTQDLEQCRTQ